jgi:hypothetical protein
MFGGWLIKLQKALKHLLLSEYATRAELYKFVDEELTSITIKSAKIK